MKSRGGDDHMYCYQKLRVKQWMQDWTGVDGGSEVSLSLSRYLYLLVQLQLLLY